MFCQHQACTLFGQHLNIITTFQRTRLGKFVNLIRKNTTEPDIANKARALVKKWKKLVIGARVRH